MKQLNTFNKATKFNKEYFSRVNSTVEFIKNTRLWYYFKKLRFTVIPLIDYLTGWFWVKKTVRYYFELEYK